MSIALLTHRADGLGTNGGTSGSIDTTGASLLVLAVASGVSIAVTDISDSKSNTWTLVGATNYSFFGADFMQMFYAKAPAVGAGHTFTVTHTGSGAALAVACFSGVDTTAPADKFNGTGGSGTSLQPGGITPASANELILSGLFYDQAGAPSVGSGLTLLDATGEVAGTNFGCAMGYVVQTTATAINPTWTPASTTNMVAEVCSFKAAAGAAGSSIAETATASDAQAAAQGFSAAEAESAQAQDTYAAAMGMPASQGESATASDGYALQLAIAAQQAESTSCSVSFATAQGFSVTYLEAASPSAAFDDGTAPPPHGPKALPFWPWWYRLKPLSRRRIM